MKLVGKDGIVVVVETDVSLNLFFDSISGVASAIANDKPKKRFFYDKIGRNHMFAVDEKKRLFVLLATPSVSSQNNLIWQKLTVEPRIRSSSMFIFSSTRVDLSTPVEGPSMQPNGSPKGFRNLVQ